MLSQYIQALSLRYDSAAKQLRALFPLIFVLWITLKGWTKLHTVNLIFHRIDACIKVYCIGTARLCMDSTAWTVSDFTNGTARLKPQHLQTTKLITQHKPIERSADIAFVTKNLEFKLGWTVYARKTGMGSAWLQSMFMQDGVPAPRQNDIWPSKSGPNPTVLGTFDLEMCFAPQRRTLFRHLKVKKSSEPPNFFYTFDLEICFATASAFSTSPQFFTLLTWKCASGHNGVHFFTLSPVFYTFDLEMCFAPQWRLFQHLNFQKCAERGVLCTFWLGNVFRATTAWFFLTFQLSKVIWMLCVFTFLLGNVLRATAVCTFSTSQLPKVLRGSGVLYILTSKCVSRHNVRRSTFRHGNF